VIGADEIRRALEGLPRIRLAQLPTPLEPASNLSRRLKRDIWFKREDLTGLALGGNKTRMFEYLVGEAVASGADTIVAGAGAQSNYCRQLAAAARRAGLECVLVLRTVRGDADRDVQGNLLLDVLLADEVTLVDCDADEQLELLEQKAAAIRARGGRPYVPQDDGYLGSVSYVECALELLEQTAGERPPGTIVLASAGESQAGLLVGLRAAGAATRVVGVNPGIDWWDVRGRTATLANQAAERLGLEVTTAAADVENIEGFGGDGYGAVSPEGIAALKLVAEQEALLLDPVYTSKAMAALISELERGTEFPEPIVFLHTGGAPALFHYRDLLDVPVRL
jgi:1-aminocyclopropane-1-carboxylate deaminase/D-cysteine desulfhydrase-like pyridoxal-dependent ACC family enzyme